MKKYDLSTVDVSASDLGIGSSVTYDLSSVISTTSSQGRGIAVKEDRYGGATIYFAYTSDLTVRAIAVDDNGGVTGVSTLGTGIDSPWMWR